MLRTMDTYTACSIIEGFGDNPDPSLMDSVEAVAYLIKTGDCWKLQGFYGRMAQDFIDNGYISREGEITKLGFKKFEGL